MRSSSRTGNSWADRKVVICWGASGEVVTCTAILSDGSSWRHEPRGRKGRSRHRGLGHNSLHFSKHSKRYKNKRPSVERSVQERNEEGIRAWTVGRICLCACVHGKAAEPVGSFLRLFFFELGGLWFKARFDVWLKNSQSAPSRCFAGTGITCKWR